MTPRYWICKCKANGLAIHVGCTHAGKPVNYGTPRAAPRSNERDDALEKMERLHDRLEGGGWEEA